MCKVMYVKSNSYDPYFNLALEEYLVKHYNNEKEKCHILYLWQNKNTIVIGRNQNPYNECRVEKLEEMDTKLARRTTGGGAVFHDIGNLNFSIIMPIEEYNIEHSLKVIKNALLKFGIHAVYSGRNDLLVEGAKFSGNAFLRSRYSGLHHGTLLIDTDTNKLSKLLTVSKDKLEPKGITSVKSRVINLKQVCKDIEVDKLCEALKDEFRKEYAGTWVDVDSDNIAEVTNNDEFEAIYNRFVSEEWNFGQKSSYNIRRYKKFSWGGCEIQLLTVDNKIVRCTIYSDALDLKTIEYIKDRLTNSDGIDINHINDIKKEIYEAYQVEENILNDILELIVVAINHHNGEEV